MASTKSSPIAEELKRAAYRNAAGLGAKAKTATNKQTGLGAKVLPAGVKQTAKQANIGVTANGIVSKKTGMGATANRVAASATNPNVGASAQKIAAANAIGAQPRNAATTNPTTSSVAVKATPATPATATPTPVVPYETPEQIRARYGKEYADFIAQKEAEAERLRKQYNSQYDTAQRANYVNYMMTQRDLPQRLAEQGITGGMSETANLQSRTNYENLYANTEGQRQSALQGVDNDYADALYNYKAQADANMNTELSENRQLQSEYEQQLRQQNEERFANNLGAYDTLEKVEAAKRAALASGEAWKIPYLDQQGATLRQQSQATAQAEQERKEESFVNTIDRYDTVTKVDKAMKAARENGETWKIPYLSQHKASLKQQGKAETQAKQERREQRFVNNIGGYDTVEKCDAAIKSARKNGESWKIPYLRQQKATIKQQGKTEKQAQTERYEQRYANTISGFNSIDGINKEIKKIQKSGKNLWRIAYLRARRTELINAGQTGSGSGSSSSGGKSSGKSSGGGGGGGDSQTTTQQTTQEVKVPKLGGEKKKGSSISVKDVETFKSTGKGAANGKKKGRTSGGHRVPQNKPNRTKVPARAMWR